MPITGSPENITPDNITSDASSGRPFDDMRNLVTNAPVFDIEASAQVREVIDNFPGPSEPLGRLDKALTTLAGWQGPSPTISRPLIAVFAGVHGVAQTMSGANVAQMARFRMRGMSEGAAAVRGAALGAEAAFKIYEMGLEHPCEDMTCSPTLSERECAAAMAFGMEVVAEGADIIGLGSAGLGSAAAAAAIARSLYGGTAGYWADGQDAGATQRINAVEKAATLHRAAASDPLEVLRCFGGRDIAGIVGAILAARHQRIPIVLDGFIVCAAAAILHSLDPAAISHCFAGHVSDEPAHRALLDRLDLVPLLDFGIGIGDGTGAAFAVGVLKQACQAYKTLNVSSE